MNIEIRGTGFANKGAELMLAAIVDRVTQMRPGSRLSVRPFVGPYERRARYGLYQIFDVRSAGRLGWLIERLFHRGYRSRYGLIHEDEIDAVLDASGFAIGDAWQPEWVEGTEATFKRWKKQGKLIILLPQAFGPFQRNNIRTAAKQALQCADLVYARDADSYKYVASLLDGHSGLRQAPDFTNLLPAPPAPLQGVGKRPAGIIPNNQLLRHGNNDIRNAYVPFMARCAEHLRTCGFDPFLLVHESVEDTPIAKAISENITGGLTIVTEDDALHIKALIGQCVVTVGSRYHGLVSALSQGVPSIGTSWSHKYNHLFADYERGDWLVDATASIEVATAKLTEIINDFDAQRQHLLACSEKLKRQSVDMWDEVNDYLGTVTSA